MARTTTLAIAVLALVAAGLVVGGARVLARDRAELRAAYAAERLRAVDQAAELLARDVEEIGEDLELAATLLSQTTHPEVRERELHAIATIERPYLAAELRDVHGVTLARVIAADAPSDVLVRAAHALDATIEDARKRAGLFQTSPPLGAEPEELAWYRVFARSSPRNDGLVVALVVDVRPVLGRLRLLEDASSAMLVIGAHGRPAPSSSDVLARRVRELDARATPGLAHVMDLVRVRARGTVVIDSREARLLGLPDAPAVAVTSPVLIEDGEAWALALVSSTAVLSGQERTLVRRLLVGGSVAVLLVVALSIYFVRNARRAAALNERVRQADRLAHLTDKAEKILDHIPNGVIALTADGTVSAANRWLTERVGRQVIGAGLTATFPDVPAAQIAELERMVKAAVASGAPRSAHRLELPLWGEVSRVNVHAVPLSRRLDDVHALLVIEDLEPLRRIEDRLLHSEKLVTAGQLAAGIAHELGTPLNVIRARAELTISRLGDHPEAQSQQIVVEQVDHLSKLISSLLDYVRVAPPATRPVAAAQALAAVADLLAVEADRRGVRVEIDAGPADLPPLHADPGQLQQVLVNLAMNALDACERGGTVTVRARAGAGAEPHLILEVEDDGVGIDPAMRTQVFDPFYTTKKRGRGTGLGLWVVAQLVRAHGAQIDLESASTNGTLVRITWPVAR
jgi:two-component system sensor histidine kinase HydH